MEDKSVHSDKVVGVDDVTSEEPKEGLVPVKYLGVKPVKLDNTKLNTRRTWKRGQTLWVPEKDAAVYLSYKQVWGGLDDDLIEPQAPPPKQNVPAKNFQLPTGSQGLVVAIAHTDEGPVEPFEVVFAEMARLALTFGYEVTHIISEWGDLSTYDLIEIEEVASEFKPLPDDKDELMKIGQALNISLMKPWKVDTLKQKIRNGVEGDFSAAEYLRAEYNIDLDLETPEIE